MSSPTDKETASPIDLARWQKVPNLMIGIGAVLAIIGAAVNLKQFAFSWLTAFMFCLSLCMGSLFLVLVHHLFDACWSVPIRRITENISSLLFPYMAILFLPIAVLAIPQLYEWMHIDPHTDHAVHAKQPLFTIPGFYIASAACFAIWGILSHGLRRWSIAQDSSGAAECTFKMRKYAYVGIFLFAFSLTLGAILWMKALQHQFFSTMYGVQYFAGSVWTTLATVYLITMVLVRNRVLHQVIHKHQFYYIGSLLFAFTVFYAYVSFSQYFIIWNANMPEETFWFKLRENGTWFWVSMVIIFGHFFLPFLSLLRIDVKENFKFMIPLVAWAWLMHYVDMTFNVKPVAHPEGFPFLWVWLDLGCIALIVGVLIKGFLKRYASAAPYPLKDPRLIETVEQYHPMPKVAGGQLAALKPQGGHK